MTRTNEIHAEEYSYYFMEMSLTAADFQRTVRQITDMDTTDFTAYAQCGNVEDDVIGQVADSTVIFDIDSIKIGRSVGFISALKLKTTITISAKLFGAKAKKWQF